jgi:protein-arginine kinase activator protein McsA
MEDSNKKKCSKCGRTDLTLTIFANISTGEKGALCSICMRKDSDRTMKELDDELREYKKLEKMYAELIQSSPKMPDVPDALAAYAMTPLSAYRSIQATIAHLKTKKMELMTQAGSKERLKYELNQAIENEDFTKAAELKASLDKLETE